MSSCLGVSTRPIATQSWSLWFEQIARRCVALDTPSQQEIMHAFLYIHVFYNIFIYIWTLLVFERSILRGNAMHRDKSQTFFWQESWFDIYVVHVMQLVSESIQVHTYIKFYGLRNNLNMNKYASKIARKANLFYSSLDGNYCRTSIETGQGWGEFGSICCGFFHRCQGRCQGWVCGSNFWGS